MKRHLLVALMLGLALGATGCDDDFLTTIPQDVVSSGSFWQTERDFRLATNAVYRSIIGLDQMYFDGATDLAYSQQDWMRNHAYAQGHQDALTGWSRDLWNRLYEGISRANEVLTQLENTDVLSDAAKAEFEAQARFLRGHFYHELLWLFGPTPVFTAVPTVTEARETERSTRDEVYDLIMADLTAAANPTTGLPTTWPAAQYGRATRGTALAYQARNALYEASYQKYHGGNQARADQLFRVAADAAQAVMGLGVYDLHGSFRELFMQLPVPGSPEVIFDYQIVKGVNGWWAWVGFAPHSMGGNTDLTPTRALVDKFYMTDGLPISESPLYDPTPPVITYSDGVPTVVSLGMYANRDPRLYATVLFPGAEFNGTVFNSYPNSPTADRVNLTNFYNTHTGYMGLKYIDPVDQPDPWNSGLRTIKMRLGDVLLMYAEAKIELGERDASVNTAINQLRTRAGMPHVDVTAMSQEAAIALVRNERAVELAWEGLRLADIRRWAIAQNVMPGQVRGIDVIENGTQVTLQGMWIRTFSAPRDYLWPIPAPERDLNPNLAQNPGY